MENNQFLFDAPQEVLDELHAINERINEKGYALKKDAERHMELSRQYQICKVCHRPYREIKMGLTVSIPGYGGKEYRFCFEPTCMQCEWASWQMNPDINLDLRKD